MILLGTADQELEIITVYGPPKKFSGIYGPCTVMCQWAQVTAQEGLEVTDSQLLLYFMTDLRDYIIASQNSGREVLLTGDMNMPVFSEEATTFLNSCGLVDLMEAFVGTPQSAETQRGHRLTWIAGTNGVVKACCGCHMLRRNSIIPSDHKAYVIQLDTALLLGRMNNPMEPAQGRGLRSGSIGVSKYLRQVHQWVVQSKVMETLDQLETCSDDNIVAVTLNKIDKTFCQKRRNAEKAMLKKSAPWSPQLHQAYLVERFWYWACRQGRWCQKCITLAEEISWKEYPGTTDHLENHRRHKIALRTLQKCRKSSETLRIIFLTGKINEATSQIETDIYQGLLNKFEEKLAFSKLRNARGKMSGQGLTEIHVEKHDGSIEKITDVDHIEEYLLKHRQPNHFGQSEGTPLTQEPYRTWLSTDTNTPWANNLVVTRSYQTSDPEIDEFWYHISRLQSREWSTTITPEDLFRMIKSQKESVASSPSGIHYGHYKTLTAPVPGKEEEKEKYKKIQETLLLLISRIITLCISKGIALDRWRQVISVMIPKEEGNLLASKLRTIHLFEGDYQLLTAEMINSRGLQSMESCNSIHPRLYGSRCGRGTQDCAFSRVLCHQMSRLTRQPLAVGDTDAKSCFDRLLVMLAILIMRCAGMTLNTGRLISNTLINAKYTIKTAYRVSATSYSWENNRRVHGPGQGSTIGPMLSLLIFSIMFHIMEAEAQKVHYLRLSGNKYTAHNMDGFVDDTTLMTTPPPL
jgi:Reverse transcriptase (RNA-dependent DNA polymerase)